MIDCNRRNDSALLVVTIPQSRGADREASAVFVRRDLRPMGLRALRVRKVRRLLFRPGRLVGVAGSWLFHDGSPFWNSSVSRASKILADFHRKR